MQKRCTTRIMSLDIIHIDLLSINLDPLCPLYNHALACARFVLTPQRTKRVKVT